MSLYKLFSHNVEIQYKSCFLSKAMFFTVLITGLNIFLPFVLAYGSRGFWLKSHYYFEQPAVHFTYEYLLVAETDDPSQPLICGNEDYGQEEFCAEIQVQEHDRNGDGKNDILDFKVIMNMPPTRTVASVVLILGLDFQLKEVCPYHMQGLTVISREFALPPSGFVYYGDLKFYQVTHLPCFENHIDTKYNISLFGHLKKKENIVDSILEDYFAREAIVKTHVLHSRSQNGHTGSMDMKIRLRVPDTQILYIPNLLQELKWAWPQYLSMVVIFYWFFYRVKKFVFHNRLLAAWKVVNWKKS